MYMPTPFQILYGAGVIAVITVVVAFFYFCLAGLVINLKGQDAPDWWPDWIAKIFEKKAAADTTKKYLFLSNVYSPGSNVLSTFSNHSDAQCLTECSNVTACIAFMSNPSSNTCSLLSNVSYPVPSTGNNFYVVQGMEPSKMYASYTSNTVDSYTTTTMPSLTVTNYFDCASNCSSNTSCLGFVFDSTAGSCKPYDTIKSSNLSSTTTNFTSYILTNSNFATSPI